MESPKIRILNTNKIVAQLPNDEIFQISLYIDELQISFCINIVEKFALKYGFKLSTNKTSMIHFTKLKFRGCM